MTQYMVLLYAPEGDESERAARWAELPVWEEIAERLRAAGTLLANARLHPADTATTVRVRGAEPEITDGPFAITKEVLAGYFLIECDGLDEALKVAAGLPTARTGSVEVRPVANGRVGW